MRYSLLSKFSALSSYRIRGPTRSENARHLLVWVYHEYTNRVCVYIREERIKHFSRTFFPKHSIDTCCLSRRMITRYVRWRDSHPQIPRTLLGVHGIITPNLATKYDKSKAPVSQLMDECFLAPLFEKSPRAKPFIRK